MILIISLSMSLVISLCSASDCISDTIYTEWERCNIEDGSFETYTPLSKRNFNELSELDVRVEKMFYFDAAVNSDSTLRFFKCRRYIDIIYPEKGEAPVYDNDIFLEKRYAEKYGYDVGDYILVSDTEYFVCGIGCFPDYSYVKQNSTDVSANDSFSLAAITDNTWDRMCTGNKIIYNYAYKLGNCTSREFKEKLLHLKYDGSAVKDTYIKKNMQSGEELKESFETASEALKNGALSLADGIDTMNGKLSEFGIDAEANGLYDGAVSIYDGIGRMQKQFGKYIDGEIAYEFANLSSFGEREDNIRINDAVDDSEIGKQSALVVGVFLIMLLIYMLSVFACGTIERERAQIGTLYALGYSKKEILRHYMINPMLISFIGGALGLAAGFMLTDTMAEASSGLYSFPEIHHVYPLYLIAYSMGLPAAFSYAVNRFVLSRKLDDMPLKMMHGGADKRKKSSLKLENMSFTAKYKVRQFFRELAGNATLFFGMIISVLLIMFSLSCYGSISTYINGITSDINYNYMYILRNPVSDLPKNAVVGYTRGFYADYPMTGGEMEISLLGIDRDNPYFDFAANLTDDADKVYMSDSARIKFVYKPGDKVIFHDNTDDKLYAFEIAGEVKYGSGLYFFMNLDSMRKAFGQEYIDKENLKKGERYPKASDYYYNTVFSDTKLDFKHNMLLSEVSKYDMKTGAERFMTLMWDMIVMMIAVSVIIFAAVMYLLMKLEVDRSSYSISLLKALGYSEKTVNSFYLGGSFYIMLAAIVIGIPVCRIIVGFAYPFCVSNVNAGFEAVVSPVQYGIIVLVIFVTYFLTRLALSAYLKKIKMTEILKNRE